MNNFKIGQLVIANADSQGMINGQTYIVRGVKEIITMFETTYAECAIQADNGDLFVIRNAHLLLDHS